MSNNAYFHTSIVDSINVDVDEAAPGVEEDDATHERRDWESAFCTVDGDPRDEASRGQVSYEVE
jgi:hypothetical protein